MGKDIIEKLKIMINKKDENIDRLITEKIKLKKLLRIKDNMIVEKEKEIEDLNKECFDSSF